MILSGFEAHPVLLSQVLPAVTKNILEGTRKRQAQPSRPTPLCMVDRHGRPQAGGDLAERPALGSCPCSKRLALLSPPKGAGPPWGRAGPQPLAWCWWPGDWLGRSLELLEMQEVRRADARFSPLFPCPWARPCGAPAVWAWPDVSVSEEAPTFV